MIDSWAKVFLVGCGVLTGISFLVFVVMVSRVGRKHQSEGSHSLDPLSPEVPLVDPIQSAVEREPSPMSSDLPES